MPKVRRQNIPPHLLQHLLVRIQQRHVTADQLGLLAEWLDSQPEVPAGQPRHRRGKLRALTNFLWLPAMPDAGTV